MSPSVPSAPTEAASRLFDDKFAQARRLILAGNKTAARVINDELLAERPDHCGALIQRSRLESDDDHYRLAREYALSACRVGATNKRQCMLLLRRLRLFKLIPELHRFVEQLPPEFASDPDVALSIADFHASMNDPGSVLEAVRRIAPADAAGSADLEANIGLAMLNLGRFDEARSHLEACLGIDPGHAVAWWHLSRLPGHDAAHNHVDPLRSEILRAGNPRGKALLGFALHRELDDLGDYAAATQALDSACSSMREIIDYDASANDRLFAALKSAPADSTKWRDGFMDASFTPVFIVGMHRSGTSLLEHLLSGHGEICAGGELYDFTNQLRFAADHHCRTEIDLRIAEASDRFDYAAIGRGYIEAVDWRRDGQRFVTDKLPSNFLNLGLILRALPNAKVLHMSRDPLDTCFSNLREPFSESTCRYSYDQSELAGYYRQYFALMQHWRDRFPGRIHEVTYTALATDPAAELKRITSYLGVGFQASMLDNDEGGRGVSTASAVQVRQKPGLPLRPKWQPYRDYLTPMIWRLSDVGQRY